MHFTFSLIWEEFDDFQMATLQALNILPKVHVPVASTIKEDHIIIWFLRAGDIIKNTNLTTSINRLSCSHPVFLVMLFPLKKKTIKT